MIEVSQVSKHFGDKIAVDQVSFSLDDSTITGFIGPNGAGKTTMLRMMTGILPIDEGSIRLNTLDIQKEPLKAKQEFGFISDNPDIFVAVKGIDYINFICNIYDVPKEVRQERLQGLLKDFEMEEAISQKIESYSHGMRQKIHIIATLMHEPNIWILDEPMTGLDPQSSYLLKKKMKDHAKRGNIVLFSTHVLEVAEKLCDKIIIINKGKLAFQGTLDELKSMYPNQPLETIFLKVTGSVVMEGEKDE